MSTTSFESTEGMTQECRIALRRLLLACADTKLLLGYHYGEWTFGPPEIEAAIACCSLCQTELGHVRLLHGILNKHYGDDPDALVEARQPTEFANISYLDNEIKDWAEFVAANYVVDMAVSTMLHGLKNSAFKPLHMSLEKMLQEERYHLHHGQGWFRALATKNKDTRKAIAKTVRAAVATAVEWFGPPDSEDDLALLQVGIKSASNQALLTRFLTELGNLSDALDLDVGLVKSDDESWNYPKELRWNGWSPDTRRLQKRGPSEDILYHLKGSKNKIFKLS